MSDVVSSIIEYSKKEGDWDHLKKILESALDKLRGNPQILANAVDALEPEKHTMGISYLLYARSTLSQQDRVFLSQVETLCLRLNGKQARRCPERFTQVVHKYTELCRDNNLCSRAIRTLQTAIERFRLGNEYLTPIHADYLSLCLKSMNFKAGLLLIEQKIFDIDPSITGVTPRDMLLYYYYGGMVYIGLKQFEKAARTLENALTVPAHAMNAIMVESFKKFVLVSLLVHGKFLGISKHASNIVHRHMKAYCSQYVDFANAYSEGNLEKVLKVAKEHDEIYKKDLNYGLLKQCISALYRRNIQKLTDTYMTLSLEDIAKTVKLSSQKEAEAFLVKMIENGEINAVINQKDGMVSFEEEAQTFDSPQTGVLLEDRINKTIGLVAKLQSMDNNISSSHTYIARLHGYHEHLSEMGSGGRRGIGMGDFFSAGKLPKMFDFFNR